jgi:hypothetical protein
MSRELQALQPGTLELLRAYFSTPRGQAACGADADLDPPGAAAQIGSRSGWQITQGATVAEDGLCEAAGTQLGLLDLTEEEWWVLKG